jgi:germination protein M
MDCPYAFYREEEAMYRKTCRVMLTFLVVSLPVFFAACTGKEAPPPAKATRISATRAYEKYFGPAPTSDKGTCFAFVIYFPSAREGGKAVPFPFFTFDEGSIKKVAVDRLLGGMDVASYSGEFIQAFPAGTRLLGMTQEKGTVTLDFSKEILNPKAGEAAGKAALNALVLTLSQFAGIENVRVQVEGKEGKILGYAISKGQPLFPDEAAIAQPSPPRLLSVTAVKDKGAKDVETVNAYFDRPVEIQELTMTDQQGKPFAGDTYQSVFDMAAVLKPKDPGVFKERMPIKVRWKVTDKVGRHAEGDSVWPMEVKEH